MAGDATDGSESKLWGGRFTGSPDELVERFNQSIEFDRRLYREDIAGSIAHARMLAATAIISDEDRDAIVRGLEQIRDEIEAGSFEFRIDREDIHLNIEAALIERIGDAGRRLHTARSRNDQVATDMRLFVRAACDDAAGADDHAADRGIGCDPAQAALGEHQRGAHVLPIGPITRDRRAFR